MFYVKSFDKAEKAAAHMRTIWEGILSWHNDIHSIRLMLANLKEFTAIIRAFDAAEKKK